MYKSYIELKELTYDIITNAFIKALADVDKGTAERDKHFVKATELIIKNFKAHIEGFKSPTFELDLDDTNPYIIMLQRKRFRAGVESLRKALMESLE